MHLDELVWQGITGLFNSHNILELLGNDGKTKVQKNQFGDIALLADIKAEEIIISTLKAAHCPIRLISEEHGTIDIEKSPRLLGVLDGLDGSSIYASQRETGRYGTMLGIFSHLEPSYKDYLFCGVIIHSSQQKLFYTSKGNGSFMIANGKHSSIYCSKAKKLDKITRIYVDEYFELNREVFTKNLTGFNLKCCHSSAVHYTDVAQGSVDAVLECTRKQNLEIAATYGLITEAGGVMVTLDGVSLGNKPYGTFSQDKHTPIVTASTLELAHSIIQHVSSQRSG